MRVLRQCIVILLVFCPTALIAEESFLSSEIRSGLFLLSGSGEGAAVSAGDDGVLIIDDQLMNRSEILLEAIKKVALRHPTFILNTHYHADHTGGNVSPGETGSSILAHKNIRKRLSSGQFVSFFKAQIPSTDRAGLPVVTFADGVTLHCNGDGLQVIHTPQAHADRDAVAVFKEADVIVAGDILFHGKFPFIDFEHGAKIDGRSKAIDLLALMADDRTMIVPAHGPLMSKSSVLGYRAMIAGIAGKVETLVRAGKTLDETIASKPSAAFDAKVDAAVVSPAGLVTLMYDFYKGL